jgi:hypothetical protein
MFFSPNPLSNPQINFSHSFKKGNSIGRPYILISLGKLKVSTIISDEDGFFQQGLTHHRIISLYQKSG